MAAPKEPKPASPDSEEILVVVFDSSKARFFRRLPNGRLDALQDMNSSLHRFTREQVSDKPGRSISSVGHGRSALEPKHDPHKMEKHNFVHAIAKILDDAFDKGTFKRMAIVAPERSIGEFRKEATDKLSRVVWREVPKDFTHYSDHELAVRLAPHFAPENETIEPERRA
jgi:protein required for attachment to host cells